MDKQMPNCSDKSFASDFLCHFEKIIYFVQPQ